jgi:N-acetylglucosamine kinase-like BadF-type ATPase
MILLADSGSSKTDWVVLDNQHIKEKFQTVGINPYFWTTEQILEELWANVVRFIDEKNIQQIYFYGAGCSTQAKRVVVKNAFEKIFSRATVMEIEHDLLAAARAVCIKEAGIACILGTGSNACVFDGEKIITQPINLGFWLGDEGSGGYLGKEFIKAYLHEELPKELSEIFAQQYALTLEDILENAYQKSTPNRYFAGFTTFIAQNIHQDFCQNLVRQSFDLFLEKYIQKLPQSRQLPIHFIGSVAVGFRDILKECVESKGMLMGTTLKSPIDGLVQYHNL